MQEYFGVGLMSGTSLDGLDVTYCRFWESERTWQYEILDAFTIPYLNALRIKLAQAHTFSGVALMVLHHELGVFFGKTVAQKQYHPLDFVASHGHTILHAPKEGYTLQIANPADIARYVQVPVIADFRSADVAYQGQGAPLVPFGEKHLFASKNKLIFLNLGGIANFAVHTDKQSFAGDMAFVNMALNDLVQTFFQQPYDAEGSLARQGQFLPELYQQLMQWEFYKQIPPKSLGKEQYETQIRPLLFHPLFAPKDILHTYCKHLSEVIVNTCAVYEGDIYVTGGGAHHTFLMELMMKEAQKHHKAVIIPDARTIDYKEALIFAFLGLMRWLKRPNTLTSVTGAIQTVSGGAIWLP